MKLIDVDELMKHKEMMYIMCFPDYEDGIEKECIPTYLMDVEDILNFDEVKPNKGDWDFIGDNMFRCTKCGSVFTAMAFESLKRCTTDPLVPKFCPHCGAEND